jgi:hypothetical protein
MLGTNPLTLFQQNRIYALVICLKKLNLMRLSKYSKMISMSEYTCPKCGKTFPTQDALVKHAITHKEAIEEERTPNLDFYPQ